MGNFTGLQCPVCGQTFSDGDDIVVCPDCGAPYHRSCYQKQGYCGFTDLHQKGLLWQPSASGAAASPPFAAEGSYFQTVDAYTLCPRCHAKNPLSITVCENCGWRLDIPFDAPKNVRQQASAEQPDMAHCHQFYRQRIDLNQEMSDGVTVRDLMDFVGSSALNFIVRFHILLQFPKKVNFNPFAFFFSFFYCFYRKMYKLGTLLVAFFLTVFLPNLYYTALYLKSVIEIYGVDTLIAFQTPTIQGEVYDRMMLFSMLVRIFFLITMIFCGFFFNRLYFKDCSRQIRRIKQLGNYSSGSSQYVSALRRKGGTTLAAPITVILLYFFSVFACSFTIVL